MLRVECLSIEEECLQLRLRSMTVRRIAISPPDLPLAIATLEAGAESPAAD
jgi:hypothetical protein